jgi:glycosyltransferase involved in cell wall biosynthesis
MTPIKLSICIATLNRGAFIGQTLESIITQATDEVEIVVVDGASSDNTPEVVVGFAARFPRLNYIRLPQKGGVDRDYDRTVVAAQGEYCWLMSDDDLLKPGAIAAVLAAVAQGYSLIVVNAEVRDPDLISVVEPSRLTHTADRVYTPAQADQLLADTATYMSFIGAVVIRRDVWLARERERYFGFEFIHIGVIHQAPLPGDARVLAHPWIIIRHGNAQWTTRYFKIWMFNWPELIWSFSQLSDTAKAKVVPHEPWRRPKILLTLKAKGSLTPRDFETFLAPRLAPGIRRWLVKLLAHAPGCLINLPVLLFFRWRHPDQLYAIREFSDSPYYWRNCLRHWTRRP